MLNDFPSFVLQVNKANKLFQTPNGKHFIFGAIKSFVKAAAQAGRQCSEVIRQDVRREVAFHRQGPCVKTESTDCPSSFCFFTCVHLRSEGSAENAPIAILSLRSAWPAPEARCQNSAKRLSISSSDLHFLFTLPAAESLSKHSLSSCEIIDILSARQRPSDREKSKENTSK